MNVSRETVISPLLAKVHAWLDAIQEKRRTWWRQVATVSEPVYFCPNTEACCMIFGPRPGTGEIVCPKCCEEFEPERVADRVIAHSIRVVSFGEWLRMKLGRGAW